MYMVMKKERKETMEGLEKATGYIRKLIGERVKVYYTPEILFRYDDSLEHGARINELLKKVKEEEESDREEG